jgi:ankyrin repeat protein
VPPSLLDVRLGNAIDAGDLGLIIDLIAAGVDVNGVRGEFSALMSAVEMGNEIIAKTLIDAGADVNFVTESGWTALHHAVDVECDGYAQRQISPQIAMIRLLLSKGADARVRYRELTPADDAGQRGWSEGERVLRTAE